MEPINFSESYKSIASVSPRFKELLNKLDGIKNKCNDENLVEEFVNGIKTKVDHYILDDNLHFYDESYLAYDQQNHQHKTYHDYYISTEPLYENGKSTFAPCIVFSSSQVSIYTIGKNNLPDLIYVNNEGTITATSPYKEQLDMSIDSNSNDYDVCASLVNQGNINNPQCMNNGDLLGFIQGLQPKNEKDLRLLQTIKPTVALMEKEYSKNEQRVVQNNNSNNKSIFLKALLRKSKSNKQIIEQYSNEKVL